MLDLIVSHYNCTEFEQFLEACRKSSIDCKFIIYDKSSKYNKTGDHDDTTIIRRDNIGREGETYLNHIISNYDNLNQYTLFIQDDTDQHIRNNEQFIDQCKYIMDNNYLFHLFATSWRKGGGVHIRRIVNGTNHLNTFPSPDIIRTSCERLNINLPASYNTETCAFFICHKDKIRSRSKEFYINVLLWLLEHEGNGFALEHMWKIIFA